LNATETIFALALASNVQQQQNFTFAYAQLAQLGKVEFSAIYQIPCRCRRCRLLEFSMFIKKELTVDEVLIF
jgi:2-amino-4-hydroxy-6-hydroxymethyldihydropteridine diphosphokinase